MEAELTQMRQALTHLRQELEAANRGRMAHEESAAIEKSRLEARAQELQMAQAQTDEQKVLLARATREINWLKTDPTYLETIARDRLDLMKEGETIFRLEPAKNANPPQRR